MLLEQFGIPSFRIVWIRNLRIFTECDLADDASARVHKVMNKKEDGKGASKEVEIASPQRKQILSKEFALFDENGKFAISSLCDDFTRPFFTESLFAKSALFLRTLALIRKTSLPY